MVLEAAVNGAADCLVTILERHLAPARRSFGIRVVMIGEAWKQVQRRHEKE
jgi:hypothetical protein